ncbi:MAG TPA: SDR family NAD(P)-dependent oxidoreductase [Steroidobacteraceae bacterium]
MKPIIESSALQDQGVLITGGARRVGAEIARTLHAAGANILIHYRASAAAAMALADQLNQVRPHSAAIHAAHLSTAEASEKLVAAALLEFGRLDILINNASSFYRAAAHKSGGSRRSSSRAVRMSVLKGRSSLN